MIPTRQASALTFGQSPWIQTMLCQAHLNPHSETRPGAAQHLSTAYRKKPSRVLLGQKTISWVGLALNPYYLEKEAFQESPEVPFLVSKSFKNPN